jgi:uncharacterized coiled-coil protein SlyX
MNQEDTINLTAKLNELSLKLKNYSRINEEFILRIVGYEETLKNQNMMINNLNSKIEEYERILNDTNLKLEYYNNRNYNTLLYFSFSLLIFYLRIY